MFRRRNRKKPKHHRPILGLAGGGSFSFDFGRRNTTRNWKSAEKCPNLLFFSFSAWCFDFEHRPKMKIWPLVFRYRNRKHRPREQPPWASQPIPIKLVVFLHDASRPSVGRVGCNLPHASVWWAIASPIHSAYQDPWSCMVHSFIQRLLARGVVFF